MAMNPLLFALVSICLESCLFPLSASAGAPTDEELKAMVAIANDNAVPGRALEIAKQTENVPVLLSAVDSYNVNTKIRAVEIIASLKPDKGRPALIAVLENQQLWSNRLIAGSEALTAQDILIRTVRTAVLKDFEVDASGDDLFDAVQRGALVKKMKAK